MTIVPTDTSPDDALAMPSQADLDALMQDVTDAPADDRWTLTAAGASYLAGEATAAYLDHPTVAAAVAMEDAYRLAERLGFWEGPR